MTVACNNPNIGYNQARRLDIIKAGTHATAPTSCDCSSLVRQCVREAGVEVGNFTTANEASVLTATGHFDKFVYTKGSQLYLGDILVTKTKGHTVIVTSGATRNPNSVAVPTVKMGSRGDNARLLQHNLNQCGFCGGYQLEEDGIFGKLSTAALVRWQYANKLTADGIYGKLSAAKMKEILQ
jgi:peptidoglycan hydrolase-like protein with peptidoglycan-binding domain